MSVAFGVQNQGAVGTTAAELRKIIQYKWDSTGIVGGLAVKGNSNLTYNVAAGMAICSKGASDGFTEAFWPGGNTSAVSANTASNPRLDAVWITSHDVTQGDGDNLVAVGVTQGTAAATPAAPTIPTYATLIALMLVPAGATKASSASVSSRGAGAIPYGSSLGVLVDKTDTANQAVLPASEYVYAAGTFTLPTKRQVDIKQTYTWRCQAGGADGSAYTSIFIDGTQVSACEVRAEPNLATSQYLETSVVLEAGTHTVQGKIRRGVNGDKVQRYWSKNGWAGQHLQVVDAGAVAS